MITTTIIGTATISSNNVRSIYTLQNTLNTSGSSFGNDPGTNTGLITGSWQMLPTGSNKDFRCGIFCNNEQSLPSGSFIYIAINNTSSYDILWPGDDIIRTFSGSAIIWAYATGSNNPAQLNYRLISQN